MTPLYPLADSYPTNLQERRWLPREAAEERLSGAPYRRVCCGQGSRCRLIPACLREHATQRACSASKTHQPRAGRTRARPHSSASTAEPHLFCHQICQPELPECFCSATMAPPIGQIPLQQAQQSGCRQRWVPEGLCHVAILNAGPNLTDLGSAIRNTRKFTGSASTALPARHHCRPRGSNRCDHPAVLVAEHSI